MTLTNPVIRGFAPDPSAIRVGEWYYVAVSSFEWFPTIPLYRSRDLASWEYIGSVETAVPGDNLRGFPDSGGIWAPALSYADGTLWIAYSIVESVQQQYLNLETFITRARLENGVPTAWQSPVKVSGHGFDPSLFHFEGRHWLLNLQNDHRPGANRFAGIVLTELTEDDGVLSCVGATTLLLQHDTLIEGPKLMVTDGWFYLTLAEGGTGSEHGVRMARSRELTGPYELDDRPLLTARDDPAWPLQKAGHGEFVQAPTGEWFLVHLVSRQISTPHGSQSPLGRETAVQAITWAAGGWPRLKAGGVHPSSTVSVPAFEPLGCPVEPPRPVRDHWPWSSLRAPICDDWAGIDHQAGTIRLRGRQGIESLRENSLLGQRITEHRASAQVTVLADPTSFSHSAGLVLWYNTSAYLALQLTWAEPEGEPQHGQQFSGGGRTVLSLISRSVDGPEEILRTTVERNTPCTLRAELDQGSVRFAYGRPGGPLIDFGPELDASFLSDDFGPILRFTGTFAAIACVDLIDQEFTAEFADFTLTCTDASAGAGVSDGTVASDHTDGASA